MFSLKRSTVEGFAVPVESIELKEISVS